MNNIYKKLNTLVAVLDDGVKFSEVVFEAMKQAGTPVSKSKIQGWRVNSNHKNFRRMTKQEIMEVIDALIEYYKT